MIRPRVRFSIGSLMIGIAVLALGLSLPTEMQVVLVGSTILFGFIVAVSLAVAWVGGEAGDLIERIAAGAAVAVAGDDEGPAEGARPCPPN